MAQTFDASLKHLIEDGAADWLAFLGYRPTGPVRVVNADLATISGASDKIIRVDAARPWVLHIEVFSSLRPDPVGKVQWYITLIRNRHGLPVRSVVVLLRRSANSPALDGMYHNQLPDEDQPYLQFRYQVVRLWEVPVDRLLAGGPGTIPLATLGAVAADELPQVVRQMGVQLAALPREQASELWSVAYLLAALRVGSENLKALFRGVIPVEWAEILQDTSIVQDLLAQREGKGRLSAVKAMLLRLGRKRFSEPAPTTVAAFEAITDLPRLERMTEAVIDVAGWDQLLATM